MSKQFNPQHAEILERLLSMDQLTAKIIVEHEQELREMMEHNRQAREWNRKFVAASQNDDDDAAAEAAAERNAHNNAESEIQIRLSNIARKISRSQYVGGWQEYAFNNF